MSAACRGRDASYADFVDDMRAGRVVGSVRGIRVPISARERKRNWNIRSFDFDCLLDPIYPDNILSRPLVGDCSIVDDRVDTAMLFRFHCLQFITIFRFDIVENFDDLIDDSPRIWIYMLREDGVWESRDVDCQYLVGLADFAFKQIANPEVLEIEGQPRAVLRRPSLSQGRSVPGTGIVRLTRRLYSERRDGPGEQGSPKRPHSRRPHYRRLKSREEPILVRGCMIHGGDEGPRQFRVVE